MLQIKSKFKISKRLGSPVFEQCQTQRYALSEARATAAKGRRRAKVSDYGRQLTEKQKVRFTYGLSEHQFARYVKESMTAKEPAATLFGMLESRLDSVCYRIGLASTRRAARQMVSHGHLMVNGRRMTVPSHQVHVGDKLTVRTASKNSPLFATSEEGEFRAVPVWASFDRKSLEGSITALPKFVPGDSGLDFQAVFEFYSR